MRRLAELQRLAALQRQQPTSSPVTPDASPQGILAGPSKLRATPSVGQYSTEITAEFSHVKTDLIRIAVYVLIIAATLAILQILNLRYNLLSSWAESIFRFLGLPT